LNLSIAIPDSSLLEESTILNKTKKISIIELKYFDSIGFFIAVLNKIFNKNTKETIGLGVKIWDKLIFFSKIMDLIFLNKFGKSLLCVMKKNS